MTAYFFHCFASDLMDEGPDAAFARLRGEIGVDGVVIDAVAPARLALRPRVTEAPKIASHEAAAWFQPESKHYAGARLRPNTAKAIKSRNLFARLCEAAAAQGLSISARVNPLNNETLAERHPNAACVDVFGRVHDSRLCPSNPDVREFVLAVVEDISTNYPIEVIELADVDKGVGLYSRRESTAGEPPRATFLHGLAGSEIIGDLIGLCFCPSCRHLAVERSVDAEQAAATIHEHFDSLAALNHHPWDDFARFVEENGTLASYVGVQGDAVESLLGLIHRRSRRPTWLRLEGGDVAATRMVQLPRDSAESDLLEVKTHPEDRTGYEIPCHPPHSTEGPRLVSAVHDRARNGCAFINFTDYGLAPEPCLDWVRQAIRFAKRESK